MERTILHCDCNGFFASVECVRRPELRTVPMAVCGDPENRHGIILAKNELAKRFGVATAETIWQAKKKCPQLVLVAPHHEEYARYSRLVNAIYQQYTDRVEPFGIDESWLDVTGCEALFGDGETIAAALRRRVREETGLTISVGVSFNKIFAKLGSDYKKPDATTVISRENFRQIVWPLPVSDLLYVGRAASETLRRIGITTIGELAHADRKSLELALGKLGDQLLTYANGEDESPVRRSDEKREIKSVGNGMTFPTDLRTEEEIRPCVLALADSVATRLRRHGLRGRVVQVTVRTADFRDIQRQRLLETPTCIAQEIAAQAMELIRLARKHSEPLRMITVTAASVTDSDCGEQLNLFEAGRPERREKQERAERAMDQIRKKYGTEAVSFGAELGRAPAEEKHSGDGLEE
ncbi:MAG: DNA polymerase IV [Firmicutes bacterium]|nr:DNA polymerase IV [Bacillota bacterium]